MASPDRILATTLPYILDEATEAAFNTSVLFSFLRDTSGFNRDISGDSIRVPIVVSDHSTETWHGTEGFEPTDESFQNITRYANFEWAFVTKPVVLDARSAEVNAGAAKVIDLLELHTKTAVAGIVNKANRYMLAGAVDSGPTPTILESLYGGAGTAGPGWLEGAAKASQNNTVGGLSKATYNVPGWTNAWASASGAFNTASAGRIAMDSIQTQMKTLADSPNPVDIVICSPEMFALYKASLAAQERYVDQKSLDGGNLHLMYGGAKVCPDAGLANSFSWSGDNIFSAYFLAKGAIELALLNGKGMVIKDRGASVGNAADTWQIRSGFQLIARNLGKTGVLTNGNA